MLSINRIWWEHLAPNIMHSRLRELEASLRQWCATGYGAFWLESARREEGVIRIRPGDNIPAAHFIALGSRRIFVAPPEKMRVGHRMVGGDEPLVRGPLKSDELALSPLIRFDVVTDAALIDAATRFDTSAHIPNVKEPSVVFSVPAHLLLAPIVWPRKAFVLYQHIFGDGASYPNDGNFYVWVTTRSWKARWAEHRRAVENGSPLLFHRTLRDATREGCVTYIHHKIMAITTDIEALYDAEERLVAGHWTDARRLNMIPGGKSGLRYLRENGMLGERAIPLPDERDRIVETWLREHPRKGLPAPWVSEKWKDEVWAIAQICGRDNRLSVDQVRGIRELAGTHTVESIASRIGARNADQVQRVIDGKTYVRVT